MTMWFPLATGRLPRGESLSRGRWLANTCSRHPDGASIEVLSRCCWYWYVFTCSFFLVKLWEFIVFAAYIAYIRTTYFHLALDDTSSIAKMLTKPLALQHPCHNQALETHVKLVTEAASVVTGYEKRDGMIRQKIQSRLLMSKFDSKQQFVWNQHFTYRTSSYGSTNKHCKMCCTVWLCVWKTILCVLWFACNYAELD